MNTQKKIHVSKQVPTLGKRFPFLCFRTHHWQDSQTEVISSGSQELGRGPNPSMNIKTLLKFIFDKPSSCPLWPSKKKKKSELFYLQHKRSQIRGKVNQNVSFLNLTLHKNTRTGGYYKNLSTQRQLKIISLPKKILIIAIISLPKIRYLPWRP